MHFLLADKQISKKKNSPTYGHEKPLTHLDVYLKSYTFSRGGRRWHADVCLISSPPPCNDMAWVQRSKETGCAKLKDPQKA